MFQVVDLLPYVPLLGALGVGSVIGNWFGGGRSRREMRAAVLNALTETEHTRWASDPDATDCKDFSDATRKLETAALVARVPRDAVQHYLLLARTARALSDDSAEVSNYGPVPFLDNSIDGHFSSLVRAAAEVVTELAWRPWITRMQLRRRLQELRERALGSGAEIKYRLARVQNEYGALPGALGSLPGVADPSRPSK